MVATINEVAKFLEKSYNDLINGYNGTYHMWLNDLLELDVGWMPGFDEEDSPNGDGYEICASICVNDDMPDIEWATMPYYDNGEVWDTNMAIDENCANDAEWYVEQAQEMYDEIINGDLRIPGYEAETTHTYELVIWETEDDRDMGEPFYYDETFEDLDEAIAYAKKLLSRQNYAFIEVQDEDGDALWDSDEAYVNESRRARKVRESVEDGVTIKSLKKGEYFTTKPIEYPKDTQVFIKGDYDREERKYECTYFSDISRAKYLKPDTIVYTDFIF